MERKTIGRALECSLVIPESFAKVSNEHADICLEGDVLTFCDHSSNGTTINGQAVHHSSLAIKRGDIILLAGTYELKWSEIERLFPVFHRATERFDGSQIETGGRKTEMFDGPQVNITGGKETERFDTPQSESNSRKTQPMGDGVVEEVHGQLNEYTQAETEEINEKWHMGAFLGSWVWAMCNGIYWPLAVILVSAVPYVGQAASLFLCTYLGLNGYRLAWTKCKNRDFGDFVSRQKKWTLIGAFLFVIFAVAQAASLYFIL